MIFETDVLLTNDSMGRVVGGFTRVKFGPELGDGELDFPWDQSEAAGSTRPDGVNVDTLLAIALARLSADLDSPMSCDEYEKALAHVRTALHFLNVRDERRRAEGVLGTLELDQATKDRMAERDEEQQEPDARVLID